MTAQHSLIRCNMCEQYYRRITQFYQTIKHFSPDVTLKTILGYIILEDSIMRRAVK